MKYLTPSLLALASLCFCAQAQAQQTYRRPGLVGSYSKRNLTSPMNSLTVLAGPGQPMMMGQRYKDRVIEAGGQYTMLGQTGTDPTLAPLEEQWWARAGVGFGLLPDWEAGAVFLPFRFTPTFDYSNILVFVTRGFRFEHVDFGIRLSFQTPEAKVWTFNPGIPLVWRIGGFARLDAGIYFPFGTPRAPTRAWAGFNAPVRFTVNLIPEIFIAAESGYARPTYDDAGAGTIPVGGLAGYTLLLGGTIMEFTAMASWDTFAMLDAPAGVDTVQGSNYRIVFGLSMMKLVK